MQITQKGYGKFLATNGIDVISAAFERGSKDSNGAFHPHWNLTLYGETTVAYVEKDAAVKLAAKILTEPQEKPLTDAEASAIQARDGCVHGIVGVTLGDMIDNDLDGFLDILNDKLTDALLCDISYRVAGFSEDGTVLHLRVSGCMDVA